jgi:hypothetical protein
MQQRVELNNQGRMYKGNEGVGSDPLGHDRAVTPRLRNAGGHHFVVTCLFGVPRGSFAL